MKTQAEIDIQLSDAQKHVLLIQMLQEFYTALYKDIQKEDYRLIADVEYDEKILKAVKRILQYYMIPSDYQQFKASVRGECAYEFDASYYKEV